MSRTWAQCLLFIAIVCAQAVLAEQDGNPDAEMSPRVPDIGNARQVILPPGHPLDQDTLVALDALREDEMVAMEPLFDTLLEGIAEVALPEKDEALRILARAAATGHPLAMAALGEMWLFLSAAEWPEASRREVDGILRRESEAFGADDDPLLAILAQEGVPAPGGRGPGAFHPAGEAEGAVFEA